MLITHIGFGLAGGLAAAALAYRIRSLSRSGALAAACVGGALYAFGGPIWYGLLLVFFITSTGLSKWKKARKQAAEQTYEKGSRRDAGQVLANGGLGALVCILCYIWPNTGWLYAFIGVMASVNADTWATEVGGLSRTEPRSILTLTRVPRGTSGAVSWLGSIAAGAGALTIGAAAVLFMRIGDLGNHNTLSIGSPSIQDGLFILLLALVGGLAGAFADSYLGATIQRMNRCVICQAELEQTEHCGHRTEHIRGLRWMNNDSVNGISSLVGGMAACVLGYLIL